MIKVKNAFLLFVGIMLLTGLIKKLLMVYLIIILHELGHLFFIKLFKRKINNIEIHPYGVIIDIDEDNSSNLKGLLISSGGIIVNILLMFILKGELKQINLYVMFFNMIPIYPLDGGNILKYLLAYFIKYRHLLYYLPLFSIFAIIIMFFKSFNNLNLFLVLIILLFRNIKELINKEMNYQGFLLNKYINPNIKLKNKFINVKNHIKSFYRGFNNNLGIKNKYKSEKEILKDYYSK